MQEIVHHILYIGDKNHLNITPLQLNQVAYFACGHLLKNGHKDLVEELYKEERFETRPNGPTLPITLEMYKQYNGLPILDTGHQSARLSEVEGLDEAIINLIQRDVFDLVKVSQQHFFWKQNKVYILSQIRLTYDFDTLEIIFQEKKVGV